MGDPRSRPSPFINISEGGGGSLFLSFCSPSFLFYLIIIFFVSFLLFPFIYIYICVCVCNFFHVPPHLLSFISFSFHMSACVCIFFELLHVCFVGRRGRVEGGGRERRGEERREAAAGRNTLDTDCHRPLNQHASRCFFNICAMITSPLEIHYRRDDHRSPVKSYWWLWRPDRNDVNPKVNSYFQMAAQWFQTQTRDSD